MGAVLEKRGEWNPGSQKQWAFRTQGAESGGSRIAMSRIPQGKAQLQDSKIPVLRCDHELEGESSGKGSGHKSVCKGSMKLGVWVGLRNRTKPKGHERAGDLGLSSTWGHASLIISL